MFARVGGDGPTGAWQHVRPVRLTHAVLSERARRIEKELAKVLSVEESEVREYVAEVVQERAWRVRATAERKTGFRFVRGTHSGSYVRDPEGTDPLPPGVEPPPERASKAA